jgi:CRISPR-associated protein Csx10
MWRLKIELQSPLCAGSGLGQAGYADRDVVFDGEGLPYIPGRRLKGLLRDAYREVCDCPAMKGLPQADTIFGATGVEESASFDIGDAVLGEAANLQKWLRKKGHGIVRQDVIDFFTEIRRQTAIDRQTGAAAENTLRATRLIRPRRVFYAPVGGVTDNKLEGLRLAASALQFMGTARTRGWGWVKCTLEVQEGRAGSVTESSDTDSSKSKTNGAECVLPFTVSLTRMALCPTLAGDPNTVRTEEHLPGSVIHGALARRFLAKHRDIDEFRRLFCSGKVRFLAATPLVSGNGSGERRTTRMPHSVREFKNAAGMFLNLVEDYDGEEPLRRVSGWSVPGALYKDGAGPRAEVGTTIHYHHARAKDPRIGRAVGDRYKEFKLKTPESGGALFTYESINAEQSFAGAVVGSAEDLAMVRDLVAGSYDEVRLGRSRKAQYGAGARWNWGEVKPVEESGREAGAWNDKRAAPPPKPDRLIVTLLSDLIGRNAAGHPAPELPLAELAVALDVRFKDQRGRGYTRTGIAGGYLAHQGLPRQQMPCLRAGSVFVLPIAGEFDAQKLDAVERQSFGMRTEEGYGRIALDLAVRVPNEGLILTEVQRGNTDPAEAPAEGSPQRELVMGVYRRRLEEHVRRDADAKGAATKDQYLGRVANHLLSRLMAIVERGRIEDAAREIKNLRDTVKGKLHRFWVEDGNETVDLHGFLVGRCENWQADCATFEMKVYGSGQAPWARLFPGGKPPALNDDLRRRLVRIWLKHYLRSLLWRKRGNRAVQSQPEEERGE